MPRTNKQKPEISTEQIIDRYYQRIQNGDRQKLTASELAAVINEFVRTLALLGEPEEIQLACNEEIDFLRDGYKPSTLGGSILPRYRKAIVEAIAAKRLNPKLTITYPHQQVNTGIVEERTEHYALYYLRLSQDEYAAIREPVPPRPHQLPTEPDIDGAIAEPQPTESPQQSAKLDELRSRLTDAQHQLEAANQRIEELESKLLAIRSAIQSPTTKPDEPKRLTAIQRAEQIFDAIQNYNFYREGKKVAITSGLLERTFGIHRQAAAQFLLENNARVGAHHAAMGITNPRGKNRGLDPAFLKKFVEAYIEAHPIRQG
jgi:hypothetical protein